MASDERNIKKTSGMLKKTSSGVLGPLMNGF